MMRHIKLFFFCPFRYNQFEGEIGLTTTNDIKWF